MTDAEFDAWLLDQAALRCILVEAGCKSQGIEITRYISTVGYVSGPADNPANICYVPLIEGGLQFTESLDIESSAGLSFGDIELSNRNGEYDTWLGDIWVNRSVSVYIGDVRWSRADFRQIFSGVIDNLEASGRDAFALSIRDKLQELNTPVSDQKLGGASINQERLIPLTFGECFNVSPLLVDEATHEYQVHDGAIEDIIEVRDNGVPVSITKNLADGKFTLNQSAAGVVTASVQGDKPSVYYNRVAKLIERIVTDYGRSSASVTFDDLSVFDAAHTQPVGVHVSERTNVLTIISALADSVGAQVVANRDGLLSLKKIELPPTGMPRQITAYDMVYDSIAIDEQIPVKSSVKLGFCKNWSLQPNLKTGIPEEHKDFFSEAWIAETTTDSVVAADYKLDAEPVQKDTYLLVSTDAVTETQRLLNLYKAPRMIVSFIGFAQLITLQLGEAVTLTHNRFGLAAGKTGIVIKLQIDWIALTVRVGVLL